MFQKMKALFLVGLAALGLSFASLPAVAAPPDLTSLTAAVDFSTVTTAVLAVAAALLLARPIERCAAAATPGPRS